VSNLPLFSTAISVAMVGLAAFTFYLWFRWHTKGVLGTAFLALAVAVNSAITATNSAGRLSFWMASVLLTLNFVPLGIGLYFIFRQLRTSRARDPINVDHSDRSAMKPEARLRLLG